VGFLPPTTPNYIRTASPKGRTSCLLPTTPNYPALLRGAALEQLPPREGFFYKVLIIL